MIKYWTFNTASVPQSYPSISHVSMYLQLNLTPQGNTGSIWLPEDEKALIAFLHKRQSEAGDGMNFKASVWTAAAAELEKIRVRGKAKGPSACKSKYMKVSLYLYSNAPCATDIYFNSYAKHFKLSRNSRTNLDSTRMTPPVRPLMLDPWPFGMSTSRPTREQAASGTRAGSTMSSCRSWSLTVPGENSGFMHSPSLTTPLAHPIKSTATWTFATPLT